MAPVAAKMKGGKGFVYSYGIGEIPLVKQANFSIGETKKDMMAFAYGMKEHAEVIKKTGQQNWYSEDLSMGFKIINIIPPPTGQNKKL